MRRFGGGRSGGKTAEAEAAAACALRKGKRVLYVGGEGPRFPEGPEVHLFDRYGDAMAALPKGWNLPGSNLRAVTIDDDLSAETMLGYRPCRIVDHTTQPWPDAFRKVVDFRASWCRITVEKSV